MTLVGQTSVVACVSPGVRMNDSHSAAVFFTVFQMKGEEQAGV